MIAYGKGVEKPTPGGKLELLMLEIDAACLRMGLELSISACGCCSGAWISAGDENITGNGEGYTFGFPPMPPKDTV